MAVSKPSKVTAAAALATNITWELESFTREAEMIAEKAAHIAANPPSAERTVSGDVTRLAQYVTDLLRRAATIEASQKAISLMEAESETPDK
ncbi:hypothetical protein GTY75_05260 [Streptomyces sp. SID8381]|uniref:hypothetical protein n=1 Tax=unclassified Streptomyces TaxID=2593676 RepID=UPI00035E0920|nr:MULTISPECIES: hypothetical protein [unclassified Streptomyces]MYX26082.1 hypothetical protein [Streptomyces sp. SID8381]